MQVLVAATIIEATVIAATFTVTAKVMITTAVAIEKDVAIIPKERIIITTPATQIRCYVLTKWPNK